tara:strand:+ start:146 stop:991 length:846 start_codon:yes stop_codon:yes gene_type:complete
MQVEGDVGVLTRFFKYRASESIGDSLVQMKNSGQSEVSASIESFEILNGASIVESGIWKEPYDPEMDSRVHFLKLEKGDRILMNSASLNDHEETAGQMHSIIFCLNGNLQSSEGQSLNAEHIAYNPPDNTMDLHAQSNAVLMIVDLAKAVSKPVKAFDNPIGNLQVKALDKLNWITRPKKEARIADLASEFDFKADYDSDTTFHNKFKLLDFSEGTDLATHSHPTTQFKALLTGHITYQNKDGSGEQHIYAGDLATVEHHNIYKGTTEQSNMVLIDFSPQN